MGIKLYVTLLVIIAINKKINIMKKLILMVSFIAGSVLMANAQLVQKSPEKRAAHITKKLQKTLGLNPDQAQQVNAAFLTRVTRMDSLKMNHSADKKENRQAEKEIFMSAEQSVMAVLNDTQKQQFLAWEKVQKERHMQKKESMQSSNAPN